MQINDRKKPWYVCIPYHLSRAVGSTVKPVADADGMPTEFAQRNARYVDSMPEDEQGARVVTLTAVHDFRALIAELTPAEAQDLSEALADRAAHVRMENWKTGSGFTSDRDALQVAMDAYKQAQRSARQRASELVRMVWGELTSGKYEAHGLTADSAEFGKWRIWIAEDGATASIESSSLPAEVWGVFVAQAIDRHWFRRGGWGGVQDWAKVEPGEYLAQSHRTPYADVLEVDAKGQATRLELRSVDVAKVAQALYAMRPTPNGEE
ncbi:hypothetical protein [Streptomyces phaeochromogenes]